MSTETATAKAVSSNPNAVEFPRDTYGVTQSVKREGLRAAGRVNGDKDKLRVLVASLDILKEHAIARYSSTKARVTAATEAQIARAKAEVERNEKDRLRSLELVKAEVKRLEAAAPKAAKESE